MEHMEGVKMEIPGRMPAAPLQIKTMEPHRVELTSVEYEKLNSMYPESKGSNLIGK